MTFAIAPYDRLAKIATALSCALLLGIALYPDAPIVVRGLMVLVVASCYAYSPRGFAVSGESITVKRLIGDVRVPLDGLQEARLAASDDFRGCIRVFGNGGLFGYYGRFRTSKLGTCAWYVTDRAKAVVVITSAKTVVLSPADAGGFLKALGAPASAPPILSTPSGGTGIGPALMVGVVCLAAFALHFLYAPGPPSCTLTPDALTIHDRFYGVTLKASDVDAGRIRVIDLNQEPEWRSTWKVGGFANAHYQSGWFRLANGQKVEMYRAGGERLVLLPGKAGATTVLYQAQDPERFAAEVRQKWTAP